MDAERKRETLTGRSGWDPCVLGWAGLAVVEARQRVPCAEVVHQQYDPCRPPSSELHLTNRAHVELPNGHTLDGELFHSRNNFSAATSIVRSHASDKWNEIRFQVRSSSFIFPA